MAVYSNAMNPDSTSYYIALGKNISLQIHFQAYFQNGDKILTCRTIMKFEAYQAQGLAYKVVDKC